MDFRLRGCCDSVTMTLLSDWQFTSRTVLLSVPRLPLYVYVCVCYLLGSCHVSESEFFRGDLWLIAPSLCLHFISDDNFHHLISCHGLLAWALWLTLIRVPGMLVSVTSIILHCLQSVSIIVCLPFIRSLWTSTLSQWPCFSASEVCLCWLVSTDNNYKT